MRRNALRSALSVKAGSGDVIILDRLAMDRPKTKDMVEMLGRLTDSPSALVLTAEADENVEKSARNIPDVTALRSTYLNIKDLLGHDKIVMPLSALEVIQGYLARGDAFVISEAASAGQETDEEE
jgi:large subunit ribosomal protein L4